MRVRGLKSEYAHNGAVRINVAPHAGAWIEITILLYHDIVTKSHPMRVRGLKWQNVPNTEKLFCRTPCGCVD